VNKKTKIPAFLQPILWSCDIRDLGLEEDKVYIINQILSWGAMKEFLWLFQNYLLSTIVKVFLKHPFKDYTPSRFHFVKNFILPLTGKNLNKRLYVQNLPRLIRQK